MNTEVELGRDADTEDDRWQRIVDALAVEDVVGNDDLQFLRAHAHDRRTWAAEDRLFDELQAADGWALPPSDADDSLIERVLVQARSPAVAAVRPRSIVAVAVTGVAALAAAVAAAFWIGAPTADEPAEIALLQEAPVVVQAVADEGCIGLDDGGRACPAEGSQVVVVREGGDVRLDLERGSLEVAAGEGIVRVATPLGRVVSEGGEFRVEVGPEAVTIIALVGPVFIEDGAGARQVLQAGDSLVLEQSSATTSPPATAAEPEVAAVERTRPPARERKTSVAEPPSPPSTSAQLLEHAQDQLVAGDAKAAAGTYRRLLDQYAASAEARAALLSLGRLELRSLGQPKEALSHFERYLEDGGPLAAEARRGRIEALRQLGRTSEERAAIREFLDRHPDNIHATELRVRGEQLER